MDRRDLYVLLILTLVLIGGVTLLKIQKRIPPSMRGDDAPAVRVPGALPTPPAVESKAERDEASARNFVLWVSIDGIRPDYLDRAATPFFDFLLAHSVYSLATEVVFPSVTFSSHISFATGRPVAEHGIPANRFFDRELGRIFSYPPYPWLLEAEPIWTTAQRQGIRTAVLDWPNSHAQTGPYATAHFGERYVPGLSDRDRLWQVLETWQRDPDPATLRLLMGYAVGPDSPGHTYGPDSREVEKAMSAIDAVLGDFYQEVRDFFDSIRRPGDQLFLIITSDHGMSEVHTLVHPGLLSGLEGQEGIVAVHSANLTHFTFLPSLNEAEKETLRQSALERIAEFPFASAYRKEDLPAEWEFFHPNRIGDIVVILEPGYTFSRRPREVTGAAADHGGPLGMHGYHPDLTSEMDTVTFFFRYPETFSPQDLGALSYQALHPTVAALLGVEPGANVTEKPVDLFSP